ncbi:MAG: hypothetical protein AAF317_20515 [Pseudomonadota bacterium]
MDDFNAGNVAIFGDRRRIALYGNLANCWWLRTYDRARSHEQLYIGIVRAHGGYDPRTG